MKSHSMTQGPIWKQMVLYSIPLLLANVLQQLYNAFDAAVVGNYVSGDALAAVGASGSLINMIIAFFMGLSMGSTVIISQGFGAQDDHRLHGATHTAMALALGTGVVLSAIGIIFSPALLRWIATPEEVMAEAVVYLRIFFSGMTALTVYNMGSAILRAVGDSKRPLYYLALSAVIHIAGDLIFVLVFDLGIAGVAYSTVISEIISAVLVVAALTREKGAHRLALRKIRLHRDILMQVLRLGIPAAIQHGLISFSNTIVQSYINHLGSTAMSGYAVSSKIDGFIMLPGQTMAMATTTFVGQNLGAGQVKRARTGVTYAMIMASGVTVVAAAVFMLFSHRIIGLFTSDAIIIPQAFAFMRITVPTYVIMIISQILPGALRGAGDVNFATITGIATFVVMRQIWLYFATPVWPTITTVALGFPGTWLVSGLLLFFYYRKSKWDHFARAVPPVEG